MNTRNTAKKIAVFLICLSGVALAGINAYQYRQIQAEKQRTAPITAAGIQAASDPALMHGNGPTPSGRENARQARPVSLRGGSASGDEVDVVDELEYQLAAAEEELSVVTDQLVSEAEKRAERKKIQKELQKKYMEAPAYKTAMIEQIDSQYADLFEKLNMSSEELEMFRDLLLEEFMKQQEIFASLGNPNDLSDEEQKELNRQMQAMNEEYEKKKREMLGETDYATYQAYNATQAERYNVNNFMAALDSGEALTKTQKEALIEAMGEELQYVQWEKLEGGDGFTAMYDENNMSLMLTNYTRRTDAYLKAANSILSASQLEKFDTYLEGQIEQYRLVLEMQALQSDTSSDNENVAVRVE